MDNERPLQGPDKMITRVSAPLHHFSRLQWPLISVEAGLDTALDWAGTRYSEVQNGNIVKLSAFAFCSWKYLPYRVRSEILERSSIMAGCSWLSPSVTTDPESWHRGEAAGSLSHQTHRPAPAAQWPPGLGGGV